jgi:acylglycerol lipase
MKKLPDHLPIKYGTPEDSKPPSIPTDVSFQSGQGFFRPSFDKKLWLFCRKWEPKPESGPIEATLMILHGTVDHSGVYEELAQRLVQTCNAAIFAPDMRGWGLSDGESMYLHDMDTFVQDVKSWYDEIHTQPRYRDVKTRLLMGKSIGGLLSIYCVTKYPRVWTGLIGLSGAYQMSPSMTPSPILMTGLNLLARVVPKLSVKRLFDEKLIVRDPDALQKWREDPLCCKDKAKLGYLVEMYRCMTEVEEKEVWHDIDLPVLMICGTDDQVVSPAGHTMLVKCCTANCPEYHDNRLKLIEGGYHNLLQEPSLKDSVMDEIEQWISACVPGKKG